MEELASCCAASKSGATASWTAARTGLPVGRLAVAICMRRGTERRKMNEGEREKDGVREMREGRERWEKDLRKDKEEKA